MLCAATAEFQAAAQKCCLCERWVGRLKASREALQGWCFGNGDGEISQFLRAGMKQLQRSGWSWTSRGGYSSRFGTWVEGQGSRWSGKHRVELHDMRLRQHLRQHAIIGAFSDILTIAIASLFHSFCTSHSARHEILVGDVAPHHSTSPLLFSNTSAIDLSLSPALNSRCTLTSSQPSCTLHVCTSLRTFWPFLSDESQSPV